MDLHKFMLAVARYHPFKPPTHSELLPLKRHVVCPVYFIFQTWQPQTCKLELISTLLFVIEFTIQSLFFPHFNRKTCRNITAFILDEFDQFS